MIAAVAVPAAIEMQEGLNVAIALLKLVTSISKNKIADRYFGG
jgi:hypothetical protein